MDEEEAEDDVDSPGAFLASGEVSGRAMTMAMAAAALGVKQIARTKERESDWAARVRQGREEGVGASSNPQGESGDDRHGTRGAMGWPPRPPRLL